MLVVLMDGLVLLTLAPKVPHPRKPLSPGQTGTVGDSAVRPPQHDLAPHFFSDLKVCLFG